MRFLMLFAFLACAAAAPSGLLAPVAVTAYAPILPTISPGDIQAAAINFQVKAQDFAIASVDKARELSEQAVENINEKTVDFNDQLGEKAVEEFWAAEEKKWQALDALKTAEAKLDGSVASKAQLLANNAVNPFSNLPNAPIPSYIPGVVAPLLKIEEAKAEEVKVEEVKVEEVKEEKSEPLMKSAEKEESSDSVAVDAKPEENVKSLEAKPLIAAPLVSESYKYPIVAPVVVPQLLKYGAIAPFGVQAVAPFGIQAVVPQVGLAPTIYNTPFHYQAW